jgi:ketosteroid isomerase-like protein
MNRRCLTAGIVLLVPFCVATVKGDETDSTKRKGVESALEAWGKALKAKDRTAMSRLLTDDYLHVGANGEVTDKAETLDFASAKNLSFEMKKRDNVKIRIHDDSAVVTGRTVLTVMLNGNQATFEVRDVTCLILEGDRWLYSVYQATPVTPVASQLLRLYREGLESNRQP